MNDAWEIQFSTAADIRELASRAIRVLEAFAESMSDPPVSIHDLEPDQQLRVEGAVQAARFCAAAAPILGDVELVEVLVELADAVGPIVQDLARSYSHPDDTDDMLVSSLRALLERAREPADGIAALADHVQAPMRRIAAETLQATSPRAITILRKLAGDRVAEVRNPARAALANLLQVAWWEGKFRSDPMLRMSPDDTKRLVPVVAQLAAALDGVQPGRKGGNGREDVSAIAALLAQLPDDLALEYIEDRVGGAETLDELSRYAPLVALLLAKPRGGAALIRMLQRWEAEFPTAGTHICAIVKTAAPNVPRARLIGHSITIADFALSGGMRVAHDEFRAVGAAAQIVDTAWPADADATALLERLVALYVPQLLDAEVDDTVSYHIAKAIMRSPVSHKAQRDALDAIANGFPGAWSVWFLAETLAARLPDRELRRRVLDLIRASEDARALRWAAGLLLGNLYGRKADGPYDKLAQRMFDDARIRDAAAKQHGRLWDYFFVPLRRGLTAGTLSGAEATHIVFHVQYKFERTNCPAADKRGRWFGPPSMRRPLSAAEWDAYRATRARHPPGDVGEWGSALNTIPSAPLHPADRAFLDSAIAVYRRGERDLAVYIARVLVHLGTAADLPVLDEMCADRSDLSLAGLMRHNREKLRKRLGVESTPASEPAAARHDGDGDEESGGDDGEWMDTPDGGEV